MLEWLGSRLYQPQNLEPRTSGDDGSCLLPTLCASESKRGAKAPATRKGGKNLRHELVQRFGDRPGPLNPTWAEWYMGFPLAWTELDALETQSFRSKRERRFNDCSEDVTKTKPA